MQIKKKAKQLIVYASEKNFYLRTRRNIRKVLHESNPYYKPKKLLIEEKNQIREYFKSFGLRVDLRYAEFQISINENFQKQYIPDDISIVR